MAHDQNSLGITGSLYSRDDIIYFPGNYYVSKSMN